MFRVGFMCGGWEERQREELVAMLKGAMTSMCVLLELAAQAIEDAEAERKRLQESAELETRAERGSQSDWSAVDGPLSWLVAVNVNDHGFGKLVSPPSR